MKSDRPDDKEPRIPIGIYIDIHGNYDLHYKLKCGSGLPSKSCYVAYVAIYESPDAGHGNPPVKHLIKKGNIEIEVTPDMKVEEFLARIREGIIKVL